MLSVLGGAAGMLVAYLGVKLIVALAFRTAHFVPIDAAPSLPILAFAFGVSLLTGLLFGTAPAWFTSHANPAEALRGVNRSTRDSSSLSQKSLVVVQATLSVVLLTGAGLLTRSLQKMEHQDFGFETDHRVNLSVNAPFSSYSPEKLDATYRALQERLHRIPGVESASLALYTPFTDNWGEIIVRQGQGTPNVTDDSVASSWDRVSPGYLEAMGEHIVRGRSITEQDTAAHAECRCGRRILCAQVFQAGRRSHRHALRPHRREEQRNLRDRGRCSRRQLHRPQRPLETAVVLCAAGPARAL